jgi:hypothetical protein
MIYRQLQKWLNGSSRRTGEALKKATIVRIDGIADFPHIS